MIDRLFSVTENDDLIFDAASVEEVTSSEFVAAVVARIGQAAVEEMRLGGDRRHKFVYFSVAGKMYSFTYTKKEQQILFSESRRLGKKLTWQFVIGFKAVA